MTVCKFIGLLLIKIMVICTVRILLTFLVRDYTRPVPEVSVIWLRPSWKIKYLQTETVSVVLREVGSLSNLLHEDIDWTMSWTWQNSEKITGSVFRKIQFIGDEIIAKPSVVLSQPISSTTSPKVRHNLKTTFGDGVSGHPGVVCAWHGTCLWLGGWLPADVQQNGSFWRFLPDSTFGIPESTSLTHTSSASTYTCSQLKPIGIQDAEGKMVSSLPSQTLL
ncbi:hypothetical protein R1flu_003335 [Riccia fluitans]|uniref:Uncharacterized protein n=1 Tax=Riccia fluitans TaxID=41844 RepID=A0ABD1Y8R9_9MARC